MVDLSAVQALILLRSIEKELKHSLFPPPSCTLTHSQDYPGGFRSADLCTCTPAPVPQPPCNKTAVWNSNVSLSLSLSLISRHNSAMIWRPAHRFWLSDQKRSSFASAQVSLFSFSSAACGLCIVYKHSWGLSAGKRNTKLEIENTSMCFVFFIPQKKWHLTFCPFFNS